MPSTRSKSKQEAFYAVAKGRRIGIFHTWDEAEPLVKGFAGAKYKKFASLSEARRFLGSGFENESVSINPDAETNDHSDRHEGGSTVSSQLATASGGGSHNDSPDTRSIKKISRRISVLSSQSCQADDDENISLGLGLAIWPLELHNKKKQFFHDDNLLLCITDNNLYQVHSFSPDKVHTWLTSDFIFSSSCNYFTKVDPILVCLRYFHRHALNQPANLSKVLCETPWLDCTYIKSIDWSKVCDIQSFKPMQGIPLKSQLEYRLNIERTLNYLQDKVNKVTSLIKSGKMKCIDNEQSACACALEQLFPFLPEQLYTLLVERVSSLN